VTAEQQKKSQSRKVNRVKTLRLFGGGRRELSKSEPKSFWYIRQRDGLCAVLIRLKILAFYGEITYTIYEKYILS